MAFRFMPTLLGNARTFGQRVAQIKKPTLPEPALTLPTLFPGAVGEVLAGCLNIEDLTILSQASHQTAEFKTAYKQRHFKAKLAELMGQHGLVMRNIENRTGTRLNRALIFMLVWLSLVLVALPTVLAVLHEIDESQLPAAAMYLAVACAAITAAAPMSLCAPLVPGHDLVRPHQILQRLGQVWESRVICPEAESTMEATSSCCKTESLTKNLMTWLFLFRFTWCLSTIMYLLLPFTFSLSSKTLQFSVTIGGGFAFLCSSACMTQTWSMRGRQKDMTVDDYAQMPRVERYILSCSSCVVAVTGECSACAVLSCLLAGFTLTHWLGQSCPVLAYQMLSIDAGVLLIMALTLTNGEIALVMMACVQMYTWIQVGVQRIHRRGEEMEWHNDTCRGEAFPWVNVAVGVLLFAWLCYQQKARFSEGRCVCAKGSSGLKGGTC